MVCLYDIPVHFSVAGVKCHHVYRCCYSAVVATVACPQLMRLRLPYAGFEAESEEEVSVIPGDEIIVHLEVEGWFQITRFADQTRGLVPASYVQVTS